MTAMASGLAQAIQDCRKSEYTLRLRAHGLRALDRLEEVLMSQPSTQPLLGQSLSHAMPPTCCMF